MTPISPDTEPKIRYTSRVRRGLRGIVDMDLRRCVELHIRQMQDRRQITKAQATDLELALSWLEQQADPPDSGTS